MTAAVLCTRPSAAFSAMDPARHQTDRRAHNSRTRASWAPSSLPANSRFSAAGPTCSHISGKPTRRAPAAPLAAGEGLELVDVELGGGGGRTTLRLYIDRQGGVSLDDCTSISRAVSAALDVEDPIQGTYDLEVSSPGLDRPLRTPEHFQDFAGEEVRVKAFGPIAELENRKNFHGTLRGIEDGRVLVEVDGKPLRLPRAQTPK